MTVYDASYLGLAMELEAEFITADKEHLGKLTVAYVETA